MYGVNFKYNMIEFLLRNIKTYYAQLFYKEFL